MTLRLDPAAIARLKTSPGFRAAQRAAAEEIVRQARAVAPDGGTHPGYRESLGVTDGRHLGVAQGEIRAETTDFAGWIIEHGSINNPPYAPLRRGARAAGLRLRDPN
jgi:hypothetical protein